MDRSATFVAYALLAVAFVALLHGSLDAHYEHLLRSRLDPAPGGRGFANTRILSLLAIRPMMWLGLSMSLASLFLAVLATAGTLIVFERYLSAWGLLESRSVLLAPAILLPMAWNYIVLSDIHFPEDIPATLLFVLGLLLLKRKRMLAFHIVFLAAVANRETSLFLVPAMFLLQVGERRTAPLLLHVLALGGVWLGGRLLLMELLGGGAGASMHENNFAFNLRLCKSLFALNPRALRMLMLFGGLWAFLPLCAGRVPGRMLLLLMLLVPFFAVMMVAGNLDGEARIFNEMIPLVTAPVVLLFERTALGRPCRSRTASPSDKG